MSGWGQRTLGWLLVLAGAAGLAEAVRAGLAQRTYADIKFGGREDVPFAQIAEDAERAHRLYPHNYYLCIYVAEKAFLTPGASASDRIRAAQTWCDRGLRANSYDVELRELEAMLLSRTDPGAALAYWREYMDWNYWSPHNHAVLADLQARSGDFEAAWATANAIPDADKRAHARDRIRAAWEEEKRQAAAFSADKPASRRPEPPRR